MKIIINEPLYNMMMCNISIASMWDCYPLVYFSNVLLKPLFGFNKNNVNEYTMQAFWMILEYLQFRCVGQNGVIHLTYDMFEMKLDNLHMICFKEIDTC